MSSNDLEAQRAVVLSFRIQELHQLLTYGGMSKSGNKPTLQKRALEMVENSRDPNMSTKIQELSRQVPDSASPFQDWNRMSSQSKQMVPTPPQVVRPQEPSSLQLATGVRFKTLPFYTEHGVLLPPTVLGTQGAGRFQEATLMFSLTCEQATDIASNRDISPGSKLEHPFQVQLRFCQRDYSRDQPDEFPPSVCVQVNDKMFPLPNPVPGKDNSEPKRPPKALDISKMVKLVPMVPNKICVKWASSSGKGWVVTLNLVEYLTASQLLERLVKKGTRDSSFTKDIIKKKLSDDDDGIATTNIKVTLACPLGKMRMTSPCRPASCDHLQCFDAQLFIQMNERKPTWKCPVCDGAALYDTLMVDGYFLDVINAPELPEDENEIILSQDGSWHPVPKSEDAERIAREEAERKGSGMALGSEDEGGLSPSLVKPSTPLVKEIDCIDLDSD